MKLAHGEVIVIDHQLERKTIYVEYKDLPFRRRLKKWVTVPLKNPIEVLVIGERTLKNGYTDREEGLNLFCPTEYFKALLVSKNMYTKPFHVRLDSILTSKTA